MFNNDVVLSPYVIETSPLRKTYQTRSRARMADGDVGDLGTAQAARQDSSQVTFPALRIPRGGLVAIMGTSGVGKSTLLNLLAGLDRPEPVEGAAHCWIKINFPDPDGRAETIDIVANKAQIPRHRIGFVFQQGHLLSNATVGLNIGLPGVVHTKALARLGRPTVDNSAIVGLLSRLKIVEPEETRLKRAWQLSGGQAQRVAFARAIAHDPDIIFADEPTSGLDRENARGLLLILKGWLAEDRNRTVLWVTHSEELAGDLADCSLQLDVYGPDEIATRVLEPARNPHVEKLQQAAPSAATPARPTARMPASSLASKLAASEMFSRRKALRHGDWQRPLSHRLSHICESGVQARSMLRALPAMMLAFRDWRTSILFLLSGLLLYIAIAGFFVNWHLAQLALSDPLACRTEVLRKAGKAQRPFERTEVERKLAARPWLLEPDEKARKRLEPRKGFGFAAADCREGPGAFGRVTEVGWGLGAIIDGKCATDRLVDARILVAPRNEPMFRRVNVEGSGKDGRIPRSLYDLLFDGNSFPDDDLFVTYDRYEALLERVRVRLNPGQNIEQLCLVEGQDEESIARAERFPFRMTAVVEDIAAGGRRRYDVYMPDDTHQRWMEDRGGKSKDFDSAVIYFDPFEYEALGKFLADPSLGSFNYSTEDIRKVQERVYVFVATMASIGLLCLIIVLILRSYLRNWFQYYLEVNEKPLAVLVAYGVGRELLASVVMARALINLGVGILIVLVVAAVMSGLAVAVWLWLGPELNIGSAYLGMASRVTDAVTLESLALGGVGTIVSMGLVVWRMARAAVRRWYTDNPYVAPILA